MSKPIVSIILLITLIFAPDCYAISDVSFPVSGLTVMTNYDNVKLIVEVAVDNEQHAHGLMYRKNLEKDHGMLFVFDKVQHVDMWMKNTLIPLDMIFIGGNGKISHIVRSTKPESTDIISSGGDVKYALEINGGAADYYHISEGDRVVLK